MGVKVTPQTRDRHRPVATMASTKHKPIEKLPDGTPVYARRADGTRVCGSPKTRGRGLCDSDLVMANGRCRMHGGGSLSGILHPRARGLRGSDRMPRRMQADYQAGLNDPDVLNLTPDLTLMDVHLDQLKQSLENGYDENSWKVLKETADELELALDTDDENGSVLAERMIELIRRGAREPAIWREIKNTERLRAELATREMDRRIKLRMLITHDEAQALGTGMVAVIKEESARLFSKIEQELGTRLPVPMRNSYLRSVADGIGSLLTQRNARMAGAELPALEATGVAI